MRQNLQNQLEKDKAMSSSVSRVNMEVSVSEASSHLGTCVDAPHVSRTLRSQRLMFGPESVRVS